MFHNSFSIAPPYKKTLLNSYLLPVLVIPNPTGESTSYTSNFQASVSDISSTTNNYTNPSIHPSLEIHPNHSQLQTISQKSPQTSRYHNVPQWPNHRRVRKIGRIISSSSLLPVVHLNSCPGGGHSDNPPGGRGEVLTQEAAKMLRVRVEREKKKCWGGPCYNTAVVRVPTGEIVKLSRVGVVEEGLDGSLHDTQQ